ncbi:flagellar hook protein FlgE [Campylobacter sp. faydin G-24]|uniref:Flagellar hook protein FlgE n=1 Tax=Campylobacter anatolicus TaxID=2829105 RepID=A0ABS5HGM7_9BACT|nr:flagellar hook protein FlgE [Campylobacter anatolicus]MBR8462273.1 flagellar hook protein FlgE [Campylobacter anatolicus]MBR8463273.1 flagellar hook protein FlgE [Campylobacter anatolicus]MBR8465413.1 flagellar hook protein FlgE [Campylobacter anatolicus]
MMRSLWSGVSGLQAHQIAMDVEGNNIANVNTVGFKYSRANFADMLSQTPRIATAPQGELGGQNAMQIGLGTSINSTTRIFSQGTLQSTDKNTDLALQGNGFFVVSPDGGKTDYYTRNGDFVRDKVGNFVNNSGYIAQGWTRDEETGTIDTTAPISNIVIKEGLTTPARATTVINMKGNLDSGNDIGSRSRPVYALDSATGGRDYDGDGVIMATEIHNENDINSNQFYTNSKNEQVLTERGVDMGVVFDELGNGLALRDNQGIWVSYANAKTQPVTIGSTQPQNIGQLTAPNNTLNITLNGTTINATGLNSISDVAAAINAQYNRTGVRAEISAGNQLTLINRNNSGTTANTKNIHLTVNGGNTIAGLVSKDIITAYQYTYSSSQTTATHLPQDTIPRTFTTTEDLRAAIQKDARYYVDYDGDGNINANENAVTANTIAETAFRNGRNLQAVTNAFAGLTQAQQTAYANYLQAYTTAYNATAGNDDIKNAAGLAAIKNSFGTDANDGVKLTLNREGQFQLENPKNDVSDQALYFTVTGLTKESTGNAQAVNENTRLTTIMSALEGSLSPGQAVRNSGKMMMSAHGSTVEIHDSLGTKHTVSVKWTKIGTTTDGGTEWGMVIQVPEPAEINFSGEGPANVVTGSLRFNADGSLASFNPASITFTGNNGSQAGQSVRLNFGLGTDFNGLTSFDKDSTTESISQDGYEGGTLKDVKVDETGTIIGAFSNGISLGLAQVAVATFTNNEGLQAEGGNIFSRTANSGEPVIGVAGSGDKGTIAAAKLEQSNVDLSRALTQLIVVQRGFQANSKTITTSDEMLNTLLQLK